MKISCNWLKDYVDFDYTPYELAEKLTMVGFEVEEIISTLPEFSSIIVGRVNSVEKHPDADRLSVCRVEIPGEELQVICGAPNVRKGIKIPFAAAGTKLPAGLKIKKAKIRGVESFGMICSEEELGLADHSDGIWILPETWQTGTDVYEMLKGGADHVLDIAVTPNRPDGLSMIGIAREVAAMTGNQLKEPELKIDYQEENAHDYIHVEIENPNGCPRYAAMMIKDVHIAQSPQWIQDRLSAAGVRPINNVVDITNFVLMETGQPLHAFDYYMIENGNIVVRDSKPSEKFTTLDEKERALPDKTVLICDQDKAVAVGGIMGGLNSEVTEKTTHILLESAYFTPARISKSAKKLGLMTEASQRFERGVDPNGIPYAAERAAMLLEQYAGGKVCRGIVDQYPGKIDRKKFEVRFSRINQVLGTNLADQEIISILNALEIEYQNGKVSAPTFRPDLEREADIVEEVARMITFDRIPVKDQTTIKYEIFENKNDRFIDACKACLRETNFTEVITNSMLNDRENQFTGIESVKIMNPISDDMTEMRTSLIPGLLKVVAYNINRNITDLRIFEIGRIFRESKQVDESNQPYQIAGMIYGSRDRLNWEGASEAVDFYDIKGLTEAFLKKILLDKYDLILYDKHQFFEEKMCLKIEHDGRDIGYLGCIKKPIAEHFDLEKPVYGFIINMPALSESVQQHRTYVPFSKYPYTEKDLAFVLKKNIPAGDVIAEIMKAGHPLVKTVQIFDLFTGGKLNDDEKSIAFKMRFQSFDRTLKDTEVDKFFRKIIRAVEHKFNSRLRD